MKNWIAELDLVKKAFGEVVELSQNARSAYLREHYGDEALQREVLALLEYHALADDPLEHGCEALLTTLAETESFEETGHAPEIPGYEQFARIATGGQSVVYRARQISTGQIVAVKVLLGTFRSAVSIDRLQKEARLLADLQHPNIITVIDQPQTNKGESCVVTRFIRGVPLDQFAEQLSEDKWDVLLVVCRRIAYAVDAAHRSGVVHRDLKPSNIIVDDNNEPFVLDFGLASTLSNESHLEPSIKTQGGQFLGSVPWASPEQIDEAYGAVTPQTDIYQLGVVFYQLFSGGSFPYALEGGCLRVFHRILNDEPADLANHDLSPSQVAQLNYVLKRALRKSPQDRYATAVEFYKAIADAMEDRSQAASTPQGRPSRRRAPLVSSILLLLLLGTGTWLFSSRKNTPQVSGEASPPGHPKAGANPVDTKSLIDVDFARLRAPHLPNGWRGDDPLFVARGQLTVPKGTRAPVMAYSNTIAVQGDWVLTIEHQCAGNGVLQFSLVDDAGTSIDVTIHRARIEHNPGRSEATKVLGQRTLAIRREADRLIATLQGARPLYLDASTFGTLTQLRFGMSNSGSGGGDVGVYRVQLNRPRAQNAGTGVKTTSTTDHFQRR